MEEPKIIRFGWAKIVTDEFAVLEKYDPALSADISINIGFDAMPADKMVAVQVKCLFSQQQKTYLVIAISCLFILVEEDWQYMHDKEQKIVTVSLQPALHLASLSLSTLRGVLHARTEGLPVNAFVMPPINLNEILKEKVVIALKEIF